jgi:putative hydrolase of HD superfamily
MKLEKEIQFILAVDALKNVQRRNYNADDSRRENTAEHSWQIVYWHRSFIHMLKTKSRLIY